MAMIEMGLWGLSFLFSNDYLRGTVGIHTYTAIAHAQRLGIRLAERFRRIGTQTLASMGREGAHDGGRAEGAYSHRVRGSLRKVIHGYALPVPVTDFSNA
eukprot:4882136-Pyramimonas_sp.AAC.3